jgi:N-acetylmuramoyl-L-alanine amidase
MGLMEALLWLTLNVYHEARNQDQFDQIAIAHVTINRAKKHNKSIKATVLSYKQFSWTYLKQDWYPYDHKAFLQCLQSVLIAKQGHDFTGGATHYHEKKLKPVWRKGMVYLADYGSHKFYKVNYSRRLTRR